MRRLLAALVMVVALAGMAWADNLSPGAFAEEFAKGIRAALPSAVVTVTSDLEVTIRFAGRTRKSTIAGAYEGYLDGRLSLKSVIDAEILDLTAPRLPSRVQQKLSPRAFTEEIAAAIRAAAPSVPVIVGKELEIEIRHPNGQNVIAALTTSYDVYSKEPQRLKELIDLHVERLATDEWAKAHAKLDHSTIIPVVKNRQWLEDAEKKIRDARATQTQLVDNFVDDLVVAYAEDTTNMFRYLTTSEYEGKREQLRPLALQNLKRLDPQVDIQPINEYVTAVTAGDDYTSSLLLLDTFWSSPGRFKVKGDVVVAIPARDVILVTGSGFGMIRPFRGMVSDLYKKGPYSLSQTLLVYRNNRFTKFVGN